MRQFISFCWNLLISFALGTFGAYLYFVSYRGLLRWDLVVVSGAVFAALWLILGLVHRHFLDPDRNSFTRS
jgi:hypothetical protein